MADDGGDPTCWLGRVCQECGVFAEGELPAVCAGCGATVPDPEEGDRR